MSSSHSSSTASFSERFSVNTSGSSLSRTLRAKDKHADSYWSIDDILAGNAKVSCKFELPVMRLGHLVPGSGDDNVTTGTKMDLPFWLARVLCGKKRQIVSVEVPKVYRSCTRDIIRADANVMNFHKLGPHYYATGVKILGFELAETDAVSRALVEAFLNRFRKIMDSSQNCPKVDKSKVVMKLDEIERKLFYIGQSGVLDFEQWLKRRCHKLTISNISLNSRKRRREHSSSPKRLCARNSA